MRASSMKSAGPYAMPHKLWKLKRAVRRPVTWHGTCRTCPYTDREDGRWGGTVTDGVPAPCTCAGRNSAKRLSYALAVLAFSGW